MDMLYMGLMKDAIAVAATTITRAGGTQAHGNGCFTPKIRAANDADGRANSLRQPDSSLPQQLKGDFQEQSFDNSYKGYSFPLGSNAQSKGCWEQLLMEVCNSYVR